MMIWALILLSVIVLAKDEMESKSYDHSVRVFQFIHGKWGGFNGSIDCGPIYCEWSSGDDISLLRKQFLSTCNTNHGQQVKTLSLYHIASLHVSTKEAKPLICDLPTDATMYEIEEPLTRFDYLLKKANKHFEYCSTMYKYSTVPRISYYAHLYESEFLPILPFSQLVKGGSYVASDCHERHGGAPSRRDYLVRHLRELGFRIDGLGKCMRTPPGPEGISLPPKKANQNKVLVKRQIIRKYLFSFALENTVELGYVSEKPFDALMAGTVPVYLGDSEHLKALLPDPMAAIYVSDFHYNLTALVEYLQFLTNNETAYEQHRSWRKGYNYGLHRDRNDLLRNQWQCNICRWMVNKTTTTNHSHTNYDDQRHSSIRSHHDLYQYKLPSHSKYNPGAQRLLFLRKLSPQRAYPHVCLNDTQQQILPMPTLQSCST